MTSSKSVGGEKLLVFVVEQQRLYHGDDNLGAPPFVAGRFVDDGLKVGGEKLGKRLLGLVFQLQAIHQKEDAPGVAGAQKQLDDGGGGEGLAGAGGHFEEKASLARFHSPLQRVDGPQLVGAQKAQLVRFDVAGALGLVFPGRCGWVVRAM